jgi:aryl-alcohol dehydrogenase-like predicted oxidoreductase
VIETLPFGRTGHESTRVLFGAAALGAMSQDKADGILELLLEHGINHIDTAEGYGDSELRIGPWMREHRGRFFLATKTRARNGADARESLLRSLERLRVDQVDLIQLHNLVDEAGWEEAFAAGGAVEALAEARDEGLVRFVGVTGHGTRVATMHRRSLERFPFDSVLLPCNYTMLAQPDYAREFEALLGTCTERGVAVQTIKALARRRWEEGHTGRRFSWYEPNSSSDATLLRATLEIASQHGAAPASEELAGDVATFGMQPLFEPGQDAI